MTHARIGITRAAAGLFLGAASFALAPWAIAQQQATDANQIIQDWPETSKSAAEAMIEKYGLPHEATEQLLIWRNNGPWVRTIV